MEGSQGPPRVHGERGAPLQGTPSAHSPPEAPGLLSDGEDLWTTRPWDPPLEHS